MIQSEVQNLAEVKSTRTRLNGVVHLSKMVTINLVLSTVSSRIKIYEINK